MFKECLSRLPQQLGQPTICPPKHCFSRLPAPLHRRWYARAVKAQQTPLVQITASHWLLYSQTGNRTAYETLYFDRRRRLVDLVFGILLGEKSLCLAPALDTLWAICEETAWQLPAHNNYIAGSPQLAWPDPEHPIVDLFAAETAALLACTCQSLGDLIPAPVQQRVLYEVRRRVVTPYLTQHFWWMDNGDLPVNNWTPWCTQNLLLCVFGLPFSEQARARTMSQAAHSLDCFVRDYGPDGCCNEGAEYYGHAGLCLFGCLELLCAIAPGAFDQLWEQEKIRNMASYIQYVHIDGRYYVNFADCSPIAGRRGARDFLFARRTGNESMARFAARDWMEGLAEPDHRDYVSGINLWYQLLEAGAASAMAALAQQPPLPSLTHRYYPSVGLFLARRGDWYLAAKAGCNNDSHNHNDTGSIILYRQGRPLLIDLGVESYTRKTFSPQRYEIWTMQSQWHNLPTFDGVQQQNGADYCARNVHTDFQPEKATMEMELSAAWPAEAGLHSFVRRLELTQQGLVLRDQCAGSYRQAFLSLLLCVRPQIKENCVVLPDLAVLRLEQPCSPIQVDEQPVLDPRLRAAWPETLYRLRIPFGDGLTLTVE